MKHQKNMATASLLLLLTHLPHIHSASLPPPKPIPPLFQPVSNLTPPLTGWDPNFEVKPTYHTLPLPNLPVYMNAINLLATLALTPFSGQTPYTNSSIPGYADVLIEIKPKDPARSMQTRFAVWCVYGAVFAMEVDEKWREVVVGCVWRGVVVGWVWVLDGRVDGGGERGGLGGASASASASAALVAGKELELGGGEPVMSTEGNATGGGGSSLDADFELTMSFTAGGKPLSREEVFWTVMATLQDAAQYDDKDIVQPFEIGVGAYPCRIHMQAVDASGSGSGLNGPPIFEWKWVVEAARQIPVWMFEHRFWESFFTLEVNGYVIGEGSIYQLR